MIAFPQLGRDAALGVGGHRYRPRRRRTQEGESQPLGGYGEHYYRDQPHHEVSAIDQRVVSNSHVAILPTQMAERVPHRGAGNLHQPLQRAVQFEDQQHRTPKPTARRRTGSQRRWRSCGDQTETSEDDGEPQHQHHQKWRWDGALALGDQQPARLRQVVAEVQGVRLERALRIILRREVPELVLKLLQRWSASRVRQASPTANFPRKTSGRRQRQRCGAGDRVPASPPARNGRVCDRG